MDIYSFLIALLSGTNLLSLIMLFVNYKSNKRKSNADSKLSEFEATQRIIEIYKTMYDDVRTNYETRLKECFEQIELLKDEIKKLKNLKCEITNCKNRT